MWATISNIWRMFSTNWVSIGFVVLVSTFCRPPSVGGLEEFIASIVMGFGTMRYYFCCSAIISKLADTISHWFCSNSTSYSSSLSSMCSSWFCSWVMLTNPLVESSEFLVGCCFNRRKNSSSLCLSIWPRSYLSYSWRIQTPYRYSDSSPFCESIARCMDLSEEMNWDLVDVLLSIIWDRSGGISPPKGGFVPIPVWA